MASIAEAAASTPEAATASAAAPQVATAGTPSAPPSEAATATRTSGTRATPRRDVDLVVFGATGFTGALVADYLAHKGAAGVRIGIAGRSTGKLERVQAQLGGPAYDWPVVVANSDDQRSLAQLAGRTRAVVTTVGPFAAHGMGLVQACAEAGTHYGDLTGEVLFMRESIDRFDGKARASGARIVHSCGFDSIPSDLGVLALHLAAKRDDGVGHLTDTRFILMSMRGGVSGGTIQSMFGELDAAKEDPAAARRVQDPYALSPDRSAEPKPGDGPDPRGAHRDHIVGRWTAPFPMAPINTRVVRRSNALMDYPYGKSFRYTESMATGSGLPGRLVALGVAAGAAAGMAALSFGPTRWAAEKLLPAAGEGPGPATREKGFFDILLHTRTEEGVPYRARVSAQGDPGYAATARMLAVTGLTLAGDQALLPDRAGVLTPASGIGEELISNLKVAQMVFTAGRV